MLKGLRERPSHWFRRIAWKKQIDLISKTHKSKLWVSNGSNIWRSGLENGMHQIFLFDASIHTSMIVVYYCNANVSWLEKIRRGSDFTHYIRYVSTKSSSFENRKIILIHTRARPLFHHLHHSLSLDVRQGVGIHWGDSSTMHIVSWTSVGVSVSHFHTMCCTRVYFPHIFNSVHFLHIFLSQSQYTFSIATFINIFLNVKIYHSIGAYYMKMIKF